MAAVRLSAAPVRTLLPPGGRAGRTLASSITVDAIGRGLFLAGSVVFFTRGIGLTAAQVGAGLAVGGVVGLLATFPVGLAADRFGARRVLIALHSYRACALAAYTLVHSFAGFVLVAGLVAVASGSTVPVLQALVGSVVAAEERVTTMGYLRAAQNASFAIGGVLAAGAIALDTRTSYLALILVNAASFAVSALLVRRLPAVAPAPRPPGSRLLAVLHDRGFLAIAAGNGVLLIHTTLLTVGIPLWTLLHTGLPAVVVAPLFVLNTVLAVVLQVPVSALARTLPGSARAYRVTGLALVTCLCLLMAAATVHTGWTAVALLAAAVVALTVGETMQAAAAWSAGYALSTADSRGRYMAVLGLGSNVQTMAGPLLVTAAVGVGTWGLTALAAVLALAAALTSAVVRNRKGPS